MRLAALLALMVGSAIGGVCVAECTAAPAATESSDMPPLRYRRDDVTITLHVLTQDEVTRICGGVRPDLKAKGWTRVGCTNTKTQVITLLHPCLYGDNDRYARWLCHEIGHWNGWPGDHPK